MVVQSAYYKTIDAARGRYAKMTQDQKERIVEAVELAANGIIDKHELITKLEAITGHKFREHMLRGIAIPV